MDILERLRHRIDYYTKTADKTQFGELTYKYNKTGTVWAEITPTSGRIEDLGGNSIRASITHKITVRKKAIPQPRNDMYFVFQNQRYEVLYFLLMLHISS